MKTLYLAAGCFWGIQAKLKAIRGVVETEVGYAGGHKANPTYEEVCQGETGHAETVRVSYDEEVISTQQLVDFFWQIHDPFSKDRQGPDVGTQYRSAIFYKTQDQAEAIETSRKNFLKTHRRAEDVATEIQPFSNFYPAEDYHQNYFGRKQMR